MRKCSWRDARVNNCFKVFCIKCPTKLGYSLLNCFNMRRFIIEGIYRTGPSRRKHGDHNARRDVTPQTWKILSQHAGHLSFFLYMASMRWVTRKPPKMFTLASTNAMKPNSRAQPVP